MDFNRITAFTLEAVGMCDGRNAARGRIPAWAVRVGGSYVSDYYIDGRGGAHIVLSSVEHLPFFDEDEACRFCEMLSEKLCMRAYVECSGILKS